MSEPSPNITTTDVATNSVTIVNNNREEVALITTDGASLKFGLLNATAPISFGYNAGQTSQGIKTIAIGSIAGQTNQQSYAIAIGDSAGQNIQGDSSVAVGVGAGRYNQGENAVSVGAYAGFTGQADTAVAIGQNAGTSNQSIRAVAIGYTAGQTSQGEYAIAIGDGAGQNIQGDSSVAVGVGAGRYNQGNSSVAIGAYAGYTGQGANSIIINATGAAIDGQAAGAFYIAPVRAISDAGASGIMIYDNSTNEVTYNTAKTFVIEHPIDKDKYLVHSCLEGPEGGIYYRGKGEIEDAFDSVEVSLPDYVKHFGFDFTINITPILTKEHKVRSLCCTEVQNGAFTVVGGPGPFYWTVFGKRMNVEAEPLKSKVNVCGDGPYKYLS